MHKLTLSAAALCVATLMSAPLSSPAWANDPMLIVPVPYLFPEFPNYLSTPGPAVCRFSEYCWYTLVHPLEYAPVVAPPVRRVRTRH